MASSSSSSELRVTDIIPLPCKQPPFKNQTLIQKQDVFQIDETNLLFLFENVLDESQMKSYLSESVQVQRISGRSGFGPKPRREICYSVDGTPYVYSKIRHPTLKYPPHVLSVLPIFSSLVNDQLLLKTQSPNPYTTLSSGVDIIYDSTFDRGGSIGRHKDDEEPWGMVMIYSLGQTRFLRIRSDETKQWVNVKLSHNSLAVMWGETFQSLYTHQVDKLYPDEFVGIRLSLNVRYHK